MSFLETLLDGNNAKERKKKQLCAIAISVTALALVIALIAFAICQVVGISAGNGEEKETTVEKETVDLGETKVIELSDEAAPYTGNLLTLNDNNHYKGRPELVNIYDSRNGAYVSVLLANRGKFEGTAEMVEKLCAMVTDCNEAISDNNLVVSGAFDSSAISTQNGIYSSGEAIALDCFAEGSERDTVSINEVEKYKWIYTNAYKYGFVAVSSSSNVFRYVGKLHATAAKYNGLYLNNYLKALKNATVESPLKLNESGSYIAYTCPVNDVKVPVNYSYEISGNNVGGVIVTVNLSKSATQNTAQ